MTDSRQAGQFIPAQDVEQLTRYIDGIRNILQRVAGPVVAAAPPETIPPKPKFHLGGASQGKLAFLLPSLAKSSRGAIELTTVDFTVNQTIRTLEEQRVQLRRVTRAPCRVCI
jgi:hypothetical protein